MELESPFALEYAYKRSLGPVLSRFFTALRDGRLEGVRTASGRVLFPPSEYDPDTGDDTGEAVPCGPGGVITGWTWSEGGAPKLGVSEPVAWALIQLDGGDTSFLHVVRSPREVVSTGARVRVVWRVQRTGFITDIEHFEVTA